MAGVIVAVVDSEGASANGNVCSDEEIVWHEGAAVSLQNNLALQEGALRNASVDLLGLSEHDGLVLQVVENGDETDASIFKTALDDALLKVGVEAEHL